MSDWGAAFISTWSVCQPQHGTELSAAASKVPFRSAVNDVAKIVNCYPRKLTVPIIYSARCDTIRYDTLHLRAPKSWRTASLISCTEPNKKVMKKLKTKQPRYSEGYPIKTSHCQNVPQSKRPIVKTSPVKTSRFETKRPRWSKRPKSKRTNVNDLMQWLHSITDCVVVIYTDRDSKFKKFFNVKEITIFFEI